MMGMETTSDLGTKLRNLRKKRGESLAITAQAINTDRAYLNKIELGTIKPSERLLEKLLVHFSVEGNQATMLKQLAGHNPLKLAVVVERKEDTPMANHSSAPVASPIHMPQVTINPIQTPVLYTDSIFVNSSEYGLVLDIAQSMGDGVQQNIVTRIGMSVEHAKKLIATMQDHLDKNER